MQDALQSAIRWNIARRDAARAKNDRIAVNRFQANIDNLRQQVLATAHSSVKRNG